MKKILFFIAFALVMVAAFQIYTYGIPDQPPTVASPGKQESPPKPTQTKSKDAPQPNSAEAQVKLTFPSKQYPETAHHIKSAIEKGESAICTIDRDNADAHRKASLKGIPTKKGYDRDEWPMAMCAEGGTGADVELISASDNRGAGAWIAGQLKEYPNGTRVEIVIP